MNAKPLIPRERAERDIQEALDWYLLEAGTHVALGFIDALEQAYEHIALFPATGSPRYAHELELPGLRSWTLRRYPYTVFYLEREDCIDIWRVLHSRRDIPARLRAQPH